MVVVGRIGAVFGVRGEVRVHSLTDPPENLGTYRPWYVRVGGEWVMKRPVAIRPHGRALVARFEGFTDREAAAALVGCEIAVPRSLLPATADDEYYWVDLLDMTVVTTEGLELGTVSHLMETGANDVLVVCGERERLIPFLPGDVVKTVQRECGRIEVDWDPDF